MDRGEPQRITVVTETRNLRTLPFVQIEDPLSTGKQWEEWILGMCILHGAYFSTQHIHLILLLFHFSTFCSI
jgi:hypothetical protein